jgi:hypothetical protein
MVAGIAGASAQHSAAQDLISFLLAPDNAPVIRAKGMEP